MGEVCGEVRRWSSLTGTRNAASPAGPAARTRSPRATAPKRTIRRAYPAPAPERRPAMTDAKGIPDVAHVEGVVVVALDGGLARAVGAPREISD